ncbi:protein ASPARTIC PROTEASE IN GUARD CELL 2-like [Lycium ferocissimum]|uniref:protein ASPARTIC PROTEASE IN GUARD CELL 2-like n=1 Tax=Lycium ferocissimum TaxID=112874 RepID=UPI0028162EF7|nr:protein ASPARTIC PROTEASE IN GUARD CELL 2-like [Lycium ferocissimum]
MFVPLQTSLVPFLLLLVVLPLFLFSFPNTTTASNTHETKTSAGHAIPFPTHEHLDVKQTIKESRIHPPPKTHDDHVEEEEALHELKRNNSWKLKLLHRDKMPFSHFSDHPHRFEARMKRDVKRVDTLVRKATNNIGTTTYEAEEFGSEVISGMEQGSGEYFVRIGVGSPVREQYMVIDAGSDIVWVQCQPCTNCYHQSDPVFDPSLSASFSGVPCSSSLCDRVDNSGCHAGRCKYEVMYGDGSYTKGTMALETLTFGRTVIRDVAIGCGHSNRGMFIGAAGLLGLGGGSMSLVGQLGGQTGGAFSYCLVTRGSGSTGSLEFGREVLPAGATWVPLIRNPRAPSFYYIGMSGLGVGGARVGIPEDSFRLTEEGDGGVVMDTGTAVTRLPKEAYVAFRDAFIAQTASLPRAPAMSIFDTCYDLNGFVTVRVPTISFFLMGGPILTLPAGNFLIPVDQKGTFCFAFAPSPTRLSIIGNIQQEGIQISIDGANGFVGFGPNIC